MTPLRELFKLASKIFPNKTITASHLLFVWAQEKEAELSSILISGGLSPAEFMQALQPFLAEPIEEDKMIVTECIRSVSESSVTGWHLLNLLCHHPEHRITKALIQAGMDLKGLRKGLDDHAPEDSLAILWKNVSKAGPLLAYGRDLTAEAAEGAFDDLCDRPKQMEALLQILLRKHRANPVLTGPAGVGKTALVELLARKLARGEVPKALVGTRLFELGMSKLLAGTKYRGEFEARFQEVMEALKKADPAILFIDEFHLVWGAGRAEGAPMDAANMLKPLLNRGGIRVIGATTSEEYHRYITRDPALARRFEELQLEEPEGDLLIEIVKKQREGLEKHHGIRISDQIIFRAIELTGLHLPNRHQPDKTIALLDTSAVNAANRGAAELTEDDLLQTLEAQTGRPLTKLDDPRRLSLLELGRKLKQLVIGQEEAIDKVVSTLVYRYQHLGQPERNLGTFLFLGSTGVGKTELARSIAIALFGSKAHLLHLDMSEYRSYDAVHKLIGSSLGLPTDEEGVLSRWLYSRGSGVILFDEIEKASKEVHNLLLGMLDRGRIRNARGEELDTRQCVVILTSNALNSEAMKKGPIGFGEDTRRKNPVQLLSHTFPHEFLGRLDEIIVFKDLGDEELKKILKMRLEEELSRFQAQGVTVKYDEECLLEYLLLNLKEVKESGARGVKRLLERMILQPLAMALAAYCGKKPVTLALTDEFYRTGKVKVEASQGEEKRCPGKAGSQS